MYFVGVDLAWGERQPTGLAVLDEDGRLVHVSAVRTDEEIEAALAPYVDGPCLVAIDAPLIVTNPTGSRPAEQALSKDFRRFEAGTHPSNTGKPEFANGTRGARICKRLGLDMDPRSGRERRAIEVYPHPATVVLFGLGKTLKYKDKRGRDLDAAARRDAHPDGPRRAARDHRPRPGGRCAPRSRPPPARASCGRVEDQVDAVVCAYVALFAERWPERTTTYGDFETRLHRHADPAGRAGHDPLRHRGVRRAAPALVQAAHEYVALVT